LKEGWKYFPRRHSGQRSLDSGKFGVLINDNFEGAWQAAGAAVVFISMKKMLM
jgi:hypothetical protein